MADITVRKADTSDARFICNIYNEAIAARNSTCDLESKDPADIYSWFSNRDFAQRPIYAADHEGQLVGYLIVADFWNDRPGYKITADCGVYIAESMQKRGVGSLLLNHFLSCAPSLGILNVVTSMFADNAASYALFTKFGFRQVGLCVDVASLLGDRKSLRIVQKVLS